MVDGGTVVLGASNPPSNMPPPANGAPVNENGPSKPVNAPVAIDPNNMTGPAGYGPTGFIQPQPLAYRVDFENDPTKATAAAQIVKATLTLNTNLDPTTFQFTGFGFGQFNFTVPAGLYHYQTTIDLRPDGIDLLVPVTLDENPSTGAVTVQFQSLDPATMQPPDGINAGFLPIDDAKGDGEGYFTYTVAPEAGLHTGDQVTAQASIVFDTNSALNTPTALNTLDFGPPSSSVTGLPAVENATAFPVNWSGSDNPNGSGMAFYNVFVSDNGGPFTLFQTTSATSAVFNGRLGHTYSFYSVATDNVGNVQSIPTTFQASTTVSLNALQVLASPEAQTVPIGQQVTFTASAAGTPKPTVQWQVSIDGGSTWSNIPGATKTSLAVTATAAQNGDLYRAVFSKGIVQAATAPAALNVAFTLQAGTHPQSLTVAAGTQVTLTAAAKGSPAPSVKWQFSTDKGKTYNPVPNAISASLTFAVQAADNGDLYQAVFTNSNGSTTTATVTLLVETPPAIATPPTAQTVAVGKNATFAAAASANPQATVQWQASADGVNFTNIPHANSTTLTLSKVAITQDGGFYRAVFTNAVGQAATTPVTLAVTGTPVVTVQPLAQTVALGNPVTFAAAAKGSPEATVQWMYSTGKGQPFNVLAGATSPTLTFVPQLSDSGKLYEAVFTYNGGSLTTTAALLTVDVAPSATVPASVTVDVGQNATFSITPLGSPVPSVQWQISTNGGSTWSNVPHATSANLVLSKVTAALNGNRYRAVLTNAVGQFTTTAATLTISGLAPPSAPTPADVSDNAGQTATFSVIPAGTPAPAVQWQVSSNAGATWSNIAGATLANLTLRKVTTASDGNEYRALLTSPAGQFTTGPATLTVNGMPTVTVQPLAQTVALGNPVTFTAAANGSPQPTVQWYYSAGKGKPFSPLQDATSPILTFTPQLADSGKLYEAVFKNSNGSATTIAAALTVDVAPSAATPAAVTVNAGQTATFSVMPAGSPAPAVQWQVSTDGGNTWNNINGATSARLILKKVTAAQDGSQYRAVLTNAVGQFTTAAASLTVNSMPVIVS